MVHLFVNIQDVEEDTQTEIKEQRVHPITYSDLLKHRRIIFAFCCTFLSMLLFTFLDPILSVFMWQTFGSSTRIAGLGFGAFTSTFTISCMILPYIVPLMSKRWMLSLSTILTGVVVAFYEPSSFIGNQPSIAILFISLLAYGLISSMSYIPSLAEIDEVA